MSTRAQAKTDRSSSKSASASRKSKSPTFDNLFKYNPGQDRALDLLTGPQTHTLLFGGGRSGKTFLFVKLIVERAMRADHSRHLITRFRSNAVRASVWLDTFPKVMRLCYPHVQYQDSRQDGFTSLVRNGSQIWFGGLDDKERVDKILGQEYATIYPGECSQIPYHSILVLRTRLAQNVGLKLRGFYDLNPVGQAHWTYREFVQHIDPVTRTPLADPENFKFASINPEDNQENLDPTYLKGLRNLPGKYKDRFYTGKYVVEVDGALWTLDRIENSRIETIEPNSPEHRQLGRIAIGVDPSGAGADDKKKTAKTNDHIGIVAAGLTWDKRGVVLEDASMRGSPKEWGLRAVATYKKWKANVIVAEGNYGGEMVRSTIHAVDANVPVKIVHASRAKHVRAEPISALYEDSRVDHAGKFIELEDELCQFSSTGYTGDRSPDRADACIWALTDLMLGEETTGLLDYYAQLVAQARDKGDQVAVKQATRESRV